jgi:hypothetical protein
VRKKRKDVSLEARTFTGKSGTCYLVFKTLGGGFHVFAETNAKDAAKDCGAQGKHTRQYWRTLWLGEDTPSPR